MGNTLDDFPILIGKTIDNYLKLRTLNLNSLTSNYSELWQSCYKSQFTQDQWAKSDPRLPDDFFKNLLPTWQRNCALRTN
jgi:hypothetical protein